MDMDKHKLEMIMELCSGLLEEMSEPDDFDERLGKKKPPMAAIEITKVEDPEEEEEMEEEEYETSPKEDLRKRLMRMGK